LGASAGQLAAAASPDSLETWVRGRAEPGSILHIFTDGFESDDISVDDDGQWQTKITLPEGIQQIYADYFNPEEEAQQDLTVTALDLSGTLEPEITASRCLTCIDNRIRVNVNPGLPWNPASLRIKRLDASTPYAAADVTQPLVNNELRPVDALGRTDAEGWVLPLRPDAEYGITVEASCGGPSTEVDLVWDDTDIVHLADPDGDGIFTGSFKGSDEELQAAIEVTCGTNQTTYIGETEKNVSAPTVVDAETGSPIAGAEVTLWQGYVVTPDLQKWRLWSGEDNGQVNPQLTTADGSFGFYLPETGRYRLSITKDGYQPYRSPARNLFGVFPSRSIKLMPEVEAADQVVNISEDGFDADSLLVEPGDVVQFRNMTLSEHSATGGSAGQLAAQAQDAVSIFDSGNLTGGESVRFRFDEPGVYIFSDDENPLNQTTIVVESLNTHVFLPIIDSN
jgi:plastocyanin